jgi:hypothetical protein
MGRVHAWRNVSTWDLIIVRHSGELMPAINFKEISLPTVGADRDQFEMFARDFLELRGFKIITGPDRGADGGRDLVVEETRTGITGETKIRWLVSCKHKAHGGSSVAPADESDIHDRVRTHNCNGFMGFYSTLPSSGLAAKLNAPDLRFEVQILDSAKIESQLLDSPAGLTLARRYFPVSAAAWSREHPIPAKIFHDEPELFCANCQKDLLRPAPSGIVVEWSSFDPDGSAKGIEAVYWCCKGGCDQALARRHSRAEWIDGWEDIPDLVAPIAYLRWFLTVINEIHSGKKYSAKAMADMKKLLINLFPSIAREMTGAEKERIMRLRMIPSALGGWGV